MLFYLAEVAEIPESKGVYKRICKSLDECPRTASDSVALANKQSVKVRVYWGIGAHLKLIMGV